MHTAAIAAGTCAVTKDGTNANCAAATTSAACTTASTAGGVTGTDNACVFTAGALIGGAACKACAAGTIQLTAGADEASDCAANSCKAGHYLASSTTTKCQECVLCATGQYSANAAGACTKCAVGTYSDVLGATACKGIACVAGKYGAAAGQTAAVTCVNCQDGKYMDLTTGFAACKTCAAGKYVDKSTRIACADCSAGRSSTEGKASTAADKDTDCTACAQGMFAGVGAVCENCAAWKWTDAAAGSCIGCGAGRSSTSGGGKGTALANACTLCTAGQFAGAGAAAVAPATTGCAKCAAGKWVDAKNDATCENCSAGRSSTEGKASTTANNDTDCTVCAAGMFSATAGTVCVNCGAGKWQDSSGAADDAAKMTLRASASAKTTKCTLGMGQPGGNAYSAASTTESAGCAACVAGRFQSSVDAGIMCAAMTCAAGSASALTGRGVDKEGCNTCCAGKFSAGAAAQCATCAAGTYADETGKDTCKTQACATGQGYTVGGTMFTSKAENCAPCAAGKFNNAAPDDKTACAGCPAGQYQDATGMTSCKKYFCNMGETPMGAGLSDPTTGCTACAAGRWKAMGFADVTTTDHGYKKSSATCDLSLSVTCPTGHQPTMASFPQTRANALMAPNTQTSALQAIPKYCTACAVGFYNNAADGTACIASAPENTRTRPARRCARTTLQTVLKRARRS